MTKKLCLRYNTSAENTLEGWEKYSLPLGNGYFGMSIFGGTDVERLQFTTNVFANTYKQGGVSNFAEIYIRFNHGNVQNYERGLELNTGKAYTKYEFDGKKIEREAFVSYPDKVAAYRIRSQTGRVDFSAELVIPYLGNRPTCEGGREGEVYIEKQSLVMRGKLPARDLLFEGRVDIITDGELLEKDGKLFVCNAKESTVFFAMDTSYRLCKEVFKNGCNKALGEDPHEKVQETLAHALQLGWEELYARHLADYTELMDRVTLDLGGVDDGRTTQQLLESTRQGNREPYLEEVYYQYGRYLLISSSRANTTPASLQGVWSAHEKSPWGSGFWHNINIQMNYWHAFTSNLAETFLAYVDYANAYREQAECYASDFIYEKVPENYVEGQGECGWTIGTAAFCYEIEGQSQHSGPGTVGLTTKLFWDYYDFTRDDKVLKEVTYPTIHSAAKFLTKTVRKYEERYLCAFSASPEQILSGHFWVNGDKTQKYYHTVGCAFDQQMLYENAKDDLRCAEILGQEDKTTQTERLQLGRYEPISVGYSGQIKEYDEEYFYGEIGEAQHRHISQLVALMPGTQINRATPAWQDAARLTLQMRGDDSTGWALAHRFCAWARLGEGDHAYLLLKNLLKNRTHPNLWDVHPPFQIDGNFGATAGITEMLLQSHGGYISVLPALPKEWENVAFTGLKARGNFTVSCIYKQGEIKALEVISNVGGELRICLQRVPAPMVFEKASKKTVAYEFDGDILYFPTKKGETYCIYNIPCHKAADFTTALTATWEENGVRLLWENNGKRYAIYRAVENDSKYTLLAETDRDNYVDEMYSISNKARLTYKLVEVTANGHGQFGRGSICCLHPASNLQVERYIHKYRQTNLK
ncbi:MAG: glycoside hydrolase N-terminal domain-containing protein [Clostridia bacterium]|nr:glycoside hydrolase N-terminal domain-containing protein [Clostridia bacterium]